MSPPAQRTSVDDKIARLKSRAKENGKVDDGSETSDSDASDAESDGESDDDDSEDDSEDESEDGAEDSEDTESSDDDGADEGSDGDEDDVDEADDEVRVPASRGRAAPKLGKRARPADDDSDDEDAVDEEKEARKRAYFKDAPDVDTAVESFGDMKLSRPILRALTELGFEKPTAIQARTVPLALQGLDICASAVTGSGTRRRHSDMVAGVAWARLTRSSERGT